VLNRHVFETLAAHGQLTCTSVLDGRDPHHVTEAQFKAVARPARGRGARPRMVGVPSTRALSSVIQAATRKAPSKLIPGDSARAATPRGAVRAREDPRTFVAAAPATSADTLCGVPRTSC
jgi:hypothetical protein